jgi:DNA-binding NarL/FixJ family response regulator
MVLLVEDEADTREMLGRALERAGYGCLAARSAEEALVGAKTGGVIDVVVTDVVMGESDRRGLTLMNELRDAGIHAPIVVITAYADVDKVKMALNQGAAYLLEKPFRATELIDAIEHVRTHGGDVRQAVEQALARANLTEKESVVARHMLDGRTSGEIAELEHNSPKTIRQHVTQIYAKCGARNRAEFIRIVYVAAERQSEDAAGR